MSRLPGNKIYEVINNNIIVMVVNIPIQEPIHFNLNKKVVFLSESDLTIFSEVCY